MDVTISKSDYSCLMKIFQNNFSERFNQKISLPVMQKQFENEKSIEKQTNSSNDKNSMKIQIDCEVKNITITLFLDEFNPTVRQTNRNKTFEFLSMRIEMIGIHFQQLSHLSYNIKSQIQNFLLDDLRKTNPSNSETHLFNRNFNVDQNIPIFTMIIDCKPNNETPAINIRQVNAQFESFDLWLSSDCLMLLKIFFTLPQSS
ncbi:unnamed protein product, partial [Adineta steineri]